MILILFSIEVFITFLDLILSDEKVEKDGKEHGRDLTEEIAYPLLDII
jgi:hypothetical protein